MVVREGSTLRQTTRDVLMQVRYSILGTTCDATAIRSIGCVVRRIGNGLMPVFVHGAGARIVPVVPASGRARYHEDSNTARRPNSAAGS